MVTAPSAAPSNVRATSTSSSITVQWGMVPCIHRNGEITGYSVRYGEMGSESTQNVSVSGDDVTEITISGLAPNTRYEVSVAAVNIEGTGNFSANYLVRTSVEG